MRRSIKQLKQDKPFVKGDIIIYGVILTVIVILLCIFLIPQKQNGAKLKGIEIYYEETLIYSYDFATEIGIESEYEKCSVVERKNGNITEVTIKVPEGENVLAIETNKVYMQDADCSPFPTCVNNFAPLRSGGSVIICMPHKIKIVSKGMQSDEVVL